MLTHETNILGIVPNTQGHSPWVCGLLWQWPQWIMAGRWEGHKEGERGEGTAPKMGRYRHRGKDLGWEETDQFSCSACGTWWPQMTKNVCLVRPVPNTMTFDGCDLEWELSSTKMHNQHYEVLRGPGFCVLLDPLPLGARPLLNAQYLLDSCGIQSGRQK